MNKFFEENIGKLIFFMQTSDRKIEVLVVISGIIIIPIG
jgi:hypothetical protein